MTEEANSAIEVACSAIGLSFPPSKALVYDGKIHRYSDPGNDKKGAADAWFKGCDNGDGSYGGTIGHWRLGLKMNWSSRSSRQFSAEERAEYARKMAEERQKEAKARERQHLQVAQKADALLRKTTPAKPNHPYLIRKGVKPHSLRQLSQNLVIPLRDINGFLWTLQFVPPGEGEKKLFLTGSRATGCYFSIGPSPENTLLVGEGIATGLTIFEATGLPVVCTMSAGNLLAVSVALHDKYPSARIILCADADPVGMTKAAEAAEAVDGTVIYPDDRGVLGG